MTREILVRLKQQLLSSKHPNIFHPNGIPGYLETSRPAYTDLPRAKNTLLDHLGLIGNITSRSKHFKCSHFLF